MRWRVWTYKVFLDVVKMLKSNKTGKFLTSINNGSRTFQAFAYFQVVPKIIVPDNLKTGVTRSDQYDPTINKTYQDKAEHYGTAIIPVHLRKPPEKPNVESAVNLPSTWIRASLRNQKFFSLHELN
jgi:hypothetical protein